jgi:hypothetical protein
MRLPRLGGPPVVQRSSTAASSEVISGHGRFNEEHLAAERRKKKPTFPVPDGVTLTLYAPHGAALENDVANLIENGQPPSAADVEMRMNDGSKTQPVPTPYPYVFTKDEEVVDYTVMPADKLVVMGKPYTVAKATPLREVVEHLKSMGATQIHYACCGAGYSDRFSDLFPYRGWYIRLK